MSFHVGFWNLGMDVHYFGPRVLCAIFCGGLLGVERALKHKAAGLKTNILICLGSTLYTCISIQIVELGSHGDPSRIAAQIVSGVGFLGAGVFMQSRGTVLGLTTAALMWVVAAIGTCIGIGYLGFAVLCSILVVLILRATTLVEAQFLGRSRIFDCEIMMNDEESQAREHLNQLLVKNQLELIDFSMEVKSKSKLFNISYNGVLENHKKFVLELWETKSIQEVKQF